MTQLRPDEWCRSASACSRKAGRVEKLGLSMLAGIVFMLCIATAIASASPIFTTLLSFDGANGLLPNAVPVQGTDGNFYGTTERGGTGAGSIFKITPQGVLTTLYSFCAQTGCPDGETPSGVVQATNGDLYGTTYYGGTYGVGTVFKIIPQGTLLTTLYSFNGADGENPEAALVQARDGHFYGTTSKGGANGYGTVFTITPLGTLTTLYSFCAKTGCPDGAFPIGVVQATNGRNFYGTTERGGANGYGTVFKITPQGVLTTLYSFCAKTGCPDGENSSGLVQATDRNFYGTTFYGGTYGVGTVFKITPQGVLTTLHRFGRLGGGPIGAVQATNGNFYGTTFGGGTYGLGTVFSLSVGLAPFVEPRPVSGKVGATVIILGNNLTGATDVSFNGTAAAFTVVSSTEITTTVPDGATTGQVSVTIPSGTLTSNVNFHVP